MNKLYILLGVLLAVTLFLLILSMPVHPYKVPRAETIGGDFSCMDVNGSDVECPINIELPKNFSFGPIK
jgi:hypothetical protein